MATINEIKANNDSVIRQKTLPLSIKKTQDAALRDEVAEELRARGIIPVASTDELDEHSHENAEFILVKDVGLFRALQTGDPADDDTTFESADSGWLWEKWLDISQTSGVDRYTRVTDSAIALSDGWMIIQINIKPSEDQTLKIGLTNGGEEIMSETYMPADQTQALQVIVIAEGTAKTIYLGGITASTLFTIYKRKL